MNNKVKNVMITILIIITIAALVALYIMINQKDKSHAEEGGERPIEDMIKDSFETAEITTDLSDGSFVRIKFRIVTDDEETAKALEKDFRLENIIIKEISTKEEEDLRTGLSALERTIKSKLNELVSEGEVTDVYTTGKILQ